jgi:hypothetical protein
MMVARECPASLAARSHSIYRLDESLRASSVLGHMILDVQNEVLEVVFQFIFRSLPAGRLVMSSRPPSSSMPNSWRVEMLFAFFAESPRAYQSHSPVRAQAVPARVIRIGLFGIGGNSSGRDGFGVKHESGRRGHFDHVGTTRLAWRKLVATRLRR